MKKFIKNHILGVVILAFFSIALWSILSSGYYSDDLMFSQDKAVAKYNSQNAFGFLQSSFQRTLINVKRPIFLMSIFIVPYFLNNLFAYKVFVLIMVLLNLYLFYIYLAQIGLDKKISYLSVLLMSILFQFRLYHDPILSFYGIQQFLVSYIFSTLIFLNKFLAKKETKYLIASTISFNFLLYSYEIGVAFILLIWITIFFRDKKRDIVNVLKTSLPFIFSIVFFVFSYAFVKYININSSVPDYPGARIVLDFPKILKTFLIQVWSSFPLTYQNSLFSFLFCHDIHCWVSRIKPTHIVAVLLFSSVLFHILFKKPSLKIGIWEYFKFLFIGFILIIFPAFFISLTAKYQDELITRGWGVGYYFVYIQYFGSSLIISTFVSIIDRIHNSLIAKILKLTLIVILAMTLTVNLQNNDLIVDKANADLKYRYLTLADSLSNKILGDIEEGSDLLIVDNYNYDPYHYYSEYNVWAYSYPWKNKYFVYGYTGKKINVYNKVNEFLGKSSPSKRYVLVLNSYPQEKKIKEGYIMFGKITKNSIEKENIDLTIDKWHIYQDKSINMNIRKDNHLLINTFEEK